MVREVGIAPRSTLGTSAGFRAKLGAALYHETMDKMIAAYLQKYTHSIAKSQMKVPRQKHPVLRIINSKRQLLLLVQNAAI